MRVVNDGPRVAQTDYWSTPHARHGLLYLTINAGAIRLLVPNPTAYMLAELPPIGTRATLARGNGIYRLALHDRPADPYVLEIDVRQADRRIPKSDTGRTVPLVWYRQDGRDGVKEVRRESVQIEAGP